MVTIQDNSLHSRYFHVVAPITLEGAACNNSNAVLKLKVVLGSDLSGKTDAVMTNNAFTWNVPCMPGKSLYSDPS